MKQKCTYISVNPKKKTFTSIHYNNRMLVLVHSI